MGLPMQFLDRESNGNSVPVRTANSWDLLSDSVA